jgi:hypothetical protein
MKILSTLFLLALSVLSIPAYAITWTLGIDDSSSTPWTTDKNSAEVAGRFVYKEILALKPADVVIVKTFADLSSAHVESKTFTIDRRNRAPQVAETVARYVASLPAQTLRGTGETNILAFLQFTNGFDCQNSGKIVLLTDGIEASEYISERALLSGKPLPPPDRDFLAGCHVQMWGIGQDVDGRIPPKAKSALRAAWTAWMQKAGASSFTAIVDP